MKIPTRYAAIRGAVTGAAGVALITTAALAIPSRSLATDTPTTQAVPSITARINVAKTHQTIDGFGAATAYYQNWIAEHPNKKALYATFFKGLNLSILRLQNGYRPAKSADFAKNDADIVRGAQTALGHPIRILMSSWSPPAALKSTGDEKYGGTLAQENGAFVYDKFANYWADALGAYKKVGITPTWVSLQNEPDWKADWETCLFQPKETPDDKGVALAGYDKALAAVHRRFQSVPGAPKLLGPETLGIGNQRVQDYLGAGDSAQARQVDGVAFHLYYGGDHQAPDTFIPALNGIRDSYPAKPKWMTEFGRSDGFQTAWCIHNSLTESDANAYVYWAGLWPGVDTLITIDNPEAPRTTWKQPNGFAPTDRYYGLKHYSYFIGPGYTRVDATVSDPTVKVSAFVSGDKTRLVAVVLNTSLTAPAKLALNMAGFTAKSSAMYRSILPPPTVTPTTGEKIGVCGPGERFRALGALPKGLLTLPPRSIVTIVLTRGK